MRKDQKHNEKPFEESHKVMVHALYSAVHLKYTWWLHMVINIVESRVCATICSSVSQSSSRGQWVERRVCAVRRGISTTLYYGLWQRAAFSRRCGGEADVHMLVRAWQYSSVYEIICAADMWTLCWRGETTSDHPPCRSALEQDANTWWISL